MIRFRRSGINWEGRQWSTPPALNALMDEIETAYPERHKADGTVASRKHDARYPKSGHRPRPFTGPGIVNAVDAGEVRENDGIVLAEAIRATQDPRIRYVIHEQRIFSSYDHANGPAWTWRPHFAHENHVHGSVDWNLNQDGSPWNLNLEGGIDMKEIYARKQAALIRAGYDLGQYPPYLSTGDPDSLPGADGSWGAKSRAAEDQFMAEALAEGTIGPHPHPEYLTDVQGIK